MWIWIATPAKPSQEGDCQQNKPLELVLVDLDHDDAHEARESVSLGNVRISRSGAAALAAAPGDYFTGS